MSQIIVKRKMACGDNELVVGELISKEGDALRVTLPNRRGVIEVAASDTLPVKQVFGNMNVDVRRSSRSSIKMFPGNSSLHGMYK